MPAKDRVWFVLARQPPGAVGAVDHNRLRISGSRGKQTANTFNPTVLD